MFPQEYYTWFQTPILHSFLDYPDPQKGSLLVYFSGCEHNCPQCHNSSLQNSISNLKYSVNELFALLTTASQTFRTTQIVFTGGDPLYKHNINFVRTFLERNNKFDICIYTGYNITYAKQNNISGFKFIKTEVFQQSHQVKPAKTDEYFQLASTNQCIYDENYQLLTKNGKLYFPKEIYDV